MRTFRPRRLLAATSILLIGIIWIAGAIVGKQPISHSSHFGKTKSFAIRPARSARTFNAHINYSMTNHGPYAVLRILPADSNSTAPVNARDFGTTPVRIELSRGVDAFDIIEHSRYAPGLHEVYVAAPEFPSPLAYLQEFQADHDSDSEFFVHQPAFGNSGRWSIEPGTYMVDFDRSSGFWKIVRHEGLVAYLSVRWNRFKLTGLALLGWLLLDILIRKFVT
ncbi:MAG: hypothetical protein ACR2IE_11030 [Candidatus Sumerlaeaceae bacterium]